MFLLDFIQSLGIILTLILTVIQMWFYNKSLRASTLATIMARNDEINRVFIQNPELFVKLNESYPEVANRESSDARPLVLYSLFNLYEELHLYRKYGYVDEEIWEAWRNSMAKIFNYRYASGFWKEVKSEYRKEFQFFVDTLIR